MRLIAGNPDLNIGADDIIESTDPGIAACAGELRVSHPDDVGYARAACAWSTVSMLEVPRATLRATDVLRDGVGPCFAKLPPLVPLRRAQGVPAGLCQRLHDGSADEHLLHRLDSRQPARCRRAVQPRPERLAWTADPARGEVDCPTVHAPPTATVIDALRGSDDALALCASGLPSCLG